MRYREASSKVREQIQALEKAEGLPRRVEHIGEAFIVAGLIPEVYSPGAIGWTDKLTDIVDVGGGDVECHIPDELLARHAGKEVTIDGKTVRIDIQSKVQDSQVEDPKGTTPKGDGLKKPPSR